MSMFDGRSLFISGFGQPEAVFDAVDGARSDSEVEMGHGVQRHSPCCRFIHEFAGPHYLQRFTNLVDNFCFSWRTPKNSLMENPLAI